MNMRRRAAASWQAGTQPQLVTPVTDGRDPTREGAAGLPAVVMEGPVLADPVDRAVALPRGVALRTPFEAGRPTETPPGEEGHYWWRPSEDGDWEVHEVLLLEILQQKGLGVIDHGDAILLGDLGGQWWSVPCPRPPR